ncbi:hypothetical protein BDV10DRAFT_172507 [Aspergillus recurvatus]
MGHTGSRRKGSRNPPVRGRLDRMQRRINFAALSTATIADARDEEEDEMVACREG